MGKYIDPEFMDRAQVVYCATLIPANKIREGDTCHNCKGAGLQGSDQLFVCPLCGWWIKKQPVVNVFTRETEDNSHVEDQKEISHSDITQCDDFSNPDWRT